MIDFKVPRLKDSILIDTKEWLHDNSLLEVRKISGKPIPTYLTEIKEIDAEKGVFKNVLNKGDKVLLTRVASEVAQYRTFEVEVGDKRYYTAPIMQVIGVFKDREITFSSLQMLFDKILIKKVENNKVGDIVITSSNTMMGEVVKVGWCKFDQDWNTYPLKVKIGDKVLIRDNVTTEITLNNETYYATEESMVVGIFKGDEINLNSLNIINENILLSPYIPTKAFGSNLLTPLLNYEDEDVTDFYNRNLFKVERSDSTLTKIKKDDIILINRSITNYAYLNNEKYFILSGLADVEARIEE